MRSVCIDLHRHHCLNYDESVRHSIPLAHYSFSWSWPLFFLQMIHFDVEEK